VRKTDPCLSSLLCRWRWTTLPLLLWDRGSLSPWDPAEMCCIPFGGPGVVSSAVVPGPFVLKWYSAKANFNKEFI